MNIKEDYVSFETAKLLKEKGFDWPSYSHYKLSNGELFHFNTNCNTNLKQNDYIIAPTIQMAMKFLRKDHNICVIPTPVVTDDDGEAGCLWKYVIYKKLKVLSASETLYETVDCASDEGIKYCLENLI